jgi:glycerate dehydrogenase
MNFSTSQRYKIVVLDGFTLSHGDLSWDALHKLGNCIIYDRTAPEQILERAHNASIILTNKVVLSREIIYSLPELRYIGVMATGYNVVDCDAARERNIVVTNVPNYATESVAQLVFAHLLNLTMRVGEYAREVSAGKWSSSPDFCYWTHPLIELAGLTLGIVGFGRIGRAVARIARSFNMHVLVFDIVPPSNVPVEVKIVDLDTLLKNSDIVTLHCPLTPDNHKFINKKRLTMMKHGAFFINTARGGLVDESALADALNSGHLAGAGLDVLSIEPPPLDNPLLKAKNCFVTPHIAWATYSARKRLMTEIVENVRSFISGEPRNVVNM